MLYIVLTRRWKGLFFLLFIDSLCTCIDFLYCTYPLINVYMYSSCCMRTVNMNIFMGVYFCKFCFKTMMLVTASSACGINPNPHPSRFSLSTYALTPTSSPSHFSLSNYSLTSSIKPTPSHYYPSPISLPPTTTPPIPISTSHLYPYPTPLIYPSPPMPLLPPSHNVLRKIYLNVQNNYNHSIDFKDFNHTHTYICRVYVQKESWSAYRELDKQKLPPNLDFHVCIHVHYTILHAIGKHSYHFDYLLCWNLELARM